MMLLLLEVSLLIFLVTFWREGACLEAPDVINERWLLNDRIFLHVCRCSGQVHRETIVSLADHVLFVRTCLLSCARR